MTEPALLAGRACTLHDLTARGLDTPVVVDVVEDVVGARRWWVGQWPQGASCVAGQVAQDVQERLLDDHGLRWPECTTCPEHAVHVLRISPDLGPHPHWTCEESGQVVAPLGALPG